MTPSLRGAASVHGRRAALAAAVLAVFVAYLLSGEVRFGFALLAGLGLAYIAADKVLCSRAGIEPGPDETIAAAMALAVIALVLGWKTQPAVTLNEGMGFDGISYKAMYELFSTGETGLRLIAPYHQRVGLPYLASLLPQPPRLAFLTLHAMFWVVTSYFFVRTCKVRMKGSHHLVLLALVWLNVHWISIPRGAVSYAFVVDDALLCFLAVMAFLCLQDRLDWRLPLVIAVGTLFKETFLLWAACLICAMYVQRALGTTWRRGEAFQLGLGLAAAVVVNQFCQAIFPQVQAETLATVLAWLTARATDASSLMRLMSAALTALGPFLIMATVLNIGGRPVRQSQRAAWLVAAISLYIGVSFVSGSDLTKFVFQSAPVLLPVVLARMEEEADARCFWLLLCLLVACLPFAHVGEAIASPIRGREVPRDDYDGPYAWMMEYAHMSLVAATLAWGAMVLLAAAVYRLRDIQRSRLSSSGPAASSAD